MNKTTAASAVALLSVCFIPTPGHAFGGAHSGMVHIFAGPRASETCALMADARVACTTIGRDDLVPFDIAGQDVIKVAMGDEFGCALSADSRVFCWGNTSFGELGNSTSHGELEPVQLSGSDLDSVIDIATGADHACAIRSDGTAWCWGSNVRGQLGSYKLGIGSSTSIPTQVVLHDGSDTPLVNLKAISAGAVHTCALFTDNTGACWGYDNDGELANGTMAATPHSSPLIFDSPQTIFVLNSGLEPLIMGGGAISLGGDHACALVTDSPRNSVGCWGYNASGQLGTGDTTSRSSAYAAMDEVGKIVDAIGVSAGRYFTCANLQDGTVRCWGYNSDGQIGSPSVALGDNQVTGTPVVDTTGTKRLDNVVEIAAAERYVCARRSSTAGGENQLTCWGYDPSFDTTGHTPFTRSVDAPIFTDNFDGN